MLFFATEDYKLKCYDLSKNEVSLNGLSPVCFTVSKSDKMKIDNKCVITQININVTPVTGNVKTTLIDGTKVVFVSATATLMGASKKNKIDSFPICLADENATVFNIDTSNCTKGILTVLGTDQSTMQSVTDVCNIWISDAGQSKVRGD